MPHVRIVGKYPNDHSEYFSRWTPDLTFECGSRLSVTGDEAELCHGTSVFDGTGLCNSPLGNTMVYANYQCKSCGARMGVPTGYKHTTQRYNSLRWTGSEFVEG